MSTPGFHPDFPQRLRQRLPMAAGQGAPPQFASELTYGRHKGPAAVDARHAAVMILLYPTPAGWSLPLTLRPAELRPHGGQISLPGGTLEAGETSEQAARRELEEELGVPATEVRSLGKLSDIYVFASNHLVTPWISVCQSQPVWIPQAAEVAEVIELPLQHLASSDSLHCTDRRVGGVQFRSPHIAVGGHQIWGATCLILGELVHLLETADFTMV